MDIGIFELNDAGLRLTLGDRQSQVSPGYAAINGQELILGTAAMHRARLNPVQSNNQFWHRLSAEPLPMHNQQYRHHADLAYSQLLAVHADIPECENVVFALPGNFTREQMALLLGIVDQCPFQAVGLVDSAIAASALCASPGTSLHIDAQLHQCVFTLITVDSKVTRKQIEILPNASLLSLRDRFAKSVADQFVDQSRFDPLHSAVTEQSVYDQLPHWLAQSFDQTDMIVEVAGKTAKISRNQLVAPLKQHFQLIADVALKMLDQPVQCIVGHHLASLPGFLETLTSACEDVLSSPIIPLNDTAISDGIRQNITAIVRDGAELAFVQSLPAQLSGSSQQNQSRQSPTSTQARTPTSPAPSTESAGLKSTGASHVLIGDHAYPLGTTPLFIIASASLSLSNNASRDAIGILQRQGETVSLLPQGKPQLMCNKQTIVDNISVRGGDVISAEGVDGRLQFIEVIDSGP